MGSDIIPAVVTHDCSTPIVRGQTRSCDLNLHIYPQAERSGRSYSDPPDHLSRIRTRSSESNAKARTSSNSAILQRRLLNEKLALEIRIDRLTKVIGHGTSSPITKSSIFQVENLATHLSEFAISHAVPKLEQLQHTPPKPLPDGPFCESFLTNVDKLVSKTPPSSHFEVGEPQATGVGLLGLGYGPADIPTLLNKIPTSIQVSQCLEGYERTCAWLHRILHRPTFRNEVDERIVKRSIPIKKLVSSQDGHKSLHWLAILFATCGLGLYSDEINEEKCREIHLPVGEASQQQVARMWLQCATSALILGDYTKRPTIDALRAMAILSQFPLYISNGESVGLAIDFTTTTINLAKRLQLDVDPDDVPELQNSTFLEKDMRRRLMMSILAQEFKMGGLFCKRWGLQSPLDFKFKEPQDASDEDYDKYGQYIESGSQQTIMSGVIARYRVGCVWQLISISFSDLDNPPNHETILSLDKQLETAEANFPSWFRTCYDFDTSSISPPSTENPMFDIDRLSTYAVLAGAQIRLHRSFISPREGIPPADVELHRKRILYYGRFLLAIQKRTDFFSLKRVPFQFFALTAGIALAVYCLTSEPGAKECSSLRYELQLLCSVYQPFIQSSSILRRSHGALIFLLQSDTERLSKFRTQQDDEETNPTSREDHSEHHQLTADRHSSPSFVCSITSSPQPNEILVDSDSDHDEASSTKRRLIRYNTNISA